MTDQKPLGRILPAGLADKCAICRAPKVGCLSIKVAARAGVEPRKVFGGIVTMVYVANKWQRFLISIGTEARGIFTRVGTLVSVLHRP